MVMNNLLVIVDGLRYKSEYRNYNFKDFINSTKISSHFKLDVIKYTTYVKVQNVHHTKNKPGIEI